MPANMLAATGPTAGVLRGQVDPPLTAEENKIWQKRYRTFRETAICPTCGEVCPGSDRPAPKGPISLAPSSSNPLTVSCHICKKTTRAEKTVKSLIAIAESCNSHSPLEAAASRAPALATCTATELQYMSTTFAAVQIELRRSKNESNSKVVAVTEKLRKLQEDNVGLKAAMNEWRHGTMMKVCSSWKNCEGTRRS